MASIGRPARILVLALAVRQLNILSRSDVHHEYIPIAFCITARPGERDMHSIGMPGRVRRLSFAIGNPLDSYAIRAHLVDLLRAGSGDEKQHTRIPWVHLRLYLDCVAMGDAPEILPVQSG